MRLTLRARILAAFLVALVAFLGALGYGIVEVRRIGAELDRVQNLWLPLSQKVTALRYRNPELDPAELQALPVRTRRALANTYGVRLQQLASDLAAVQRDASTALQAAPDAETEKSVRKVVDALARVTDPAHASPSQLDELVAALEKDPGQVQARRSTFLATSRVLKETINASGRAVDDGLRADAASAQEKASSSLLALGALTAAATLFGLVATAIVGRALAPIAELIGGVKRISTGDFSRRVTVRGGGEVALLAGEFNQMAESLRSRDDRLRRLSAYNENVVESVRVGILVVDASGTVTVMNRAAEEIWGVERAARVGKPLSEIAAVAPFLGRIEGVRAGGPALRVGATRLASERAVEVAVVPFVEDGRREGVVLVAEDVTERVRVEEALVRSERLAAIGKMSSQITHEVRNPLNSLSLNVEMLVEELQESKDGEAKELLAAIASEIDRLTEITEGYLTFARLPRPALEREQLNVLVESLLRFLREEAEEAGVTVRAELAAELPEVLADENQLRAALLNVVRNSMEAIRGARVQGTLTVTTKANGKSVELTVADDGPGIPSKDLARIFDPFYSTKSDGTGLGLPLTQQIIEEHGGTIACASEPGRGTTFTIRLPLA